MYVCGYGFMPCSRLNMHPRDCLALPGDDCWITTKPAVPNDLPWEAFSLLVVYNGSSPFIEPLELQALLSRQMITEAHIVPQWQAANSSDELVSAWTHTLRYESRPIALRVLTLLLVFGREHFHGRTYGSTVEQPAPPITLREVEARRWPEDLLQGNATNLRAVSFYSNDRPQTCPQSPLYN
jgi:hypothetical protein